MLFGKKFYQFSFKQDCEQSLRMVTRARKSSEASERKKHEAEGKLGHFALSSSAELRLDSLKRSCLQSTFKRFLLMMY